MLISDALFLGRKMKHFKWEGFEAIIVDGFYRNEEGNLSGAPISMAEAVRNAVLHLDAPISEAIKMATSRVANAINMETQAGKIKAGFSASFVKFNNDATLMEAPVF